MTHCQVSSDTARYYAEQDRADAYQAEIERRAEAILDTGDIDQLLDAMTHQGRCAFQINLRVICGCRTSASSDRAAGEIRKLLNEAAARIAKVQYQEEMNARAEQLALERFYRHCERHGGAI